MTFARPTYKRERVYPTPIPLHLRSTATLGRADGCTATVEKERAIHHEGYRRLVAAFPCINCDKPGRSQHAHENDGKAKAAKLDDRRAMPLCCDEPGFEGCHTKFDQYRLLPGGRAAHIEQGRVWAAETRERIETAGLWPASLPRWTK